MRCQEHCWIAEYFPALVALLVVEVCEQRESTSKEGWVSRKATTILLIAESNDFGKVAQLN
jgi:hypothetical protein